MGGPGQDKISANGSDGNDVIYQAGGPGNDTLHADGGAGDDLVRLDGGEGDDTLNYMVSDGQDVAYILGGPGYDTLTVPAGDKSYTLVTEYGQVLCSQGEGGSYIIVGGVEEITVLGLEGNIICQPAIPPPAPLPLTTWWGLHTVVIGTEGDDNLITQGGPERNFIKQDGLGGNDNMCISGGDGDDWLEQNGGVGNKDMTIRGGSGNDFIHQVGGSGNNTMVASGDDGNDIIFQFGGPSNDDMNISGGLGNDFIYQSGGPGNDIMRVNAGEGDDIVRMDGGEGNDTLIYDISPGQDTVYIDGGPGYDTLTVNAADVFSYTLVNEYGQVICSRGTGDTYMIVRNVEHIEVKDAADNVICQKEIITADFTYNPFEGFAPLTVQLTDASQGLIDSWHWDFGDGGSSTEQNPSHIYKKAGAYSVTLTVTGPGGSNSKSAAVTAYKKGAPKAGFTMSAKGGAAPLAVQFTDTSSGWITSWVWDFGDGGSSTEQSPAHTYDTAGKFKAMLTVTGPGGYKSKSATLKVTAP